MIDDATTPRRKMGRPAKYPGEGKRPNVSLRIRQSLYDKISNLAQQNGRSMSEEMEAKVEDAFSTLHVIALANAEAAGRARAEREHVRRLGGKTFAKIAESQADLFKSALTEVCDERGKHDPGQFSDDDVKLLAQKLADGQAEIARDWFARIKQAGALSKFKPKSFQEILEFIKKPEGASMKQALEEYLDLFFRPEQPSDASYDQASDGQK